MFIEGCTALKGLYVVVKLVITKDFSYLQRRVKMMERGRRGALRARYRGGHVARPWNRRRRQQQQHGVLVVAEGRNNNSDDNSKRRLLVHLVRAVKGQVGHREWAGAGLRGVAGRPRAASQHRHLHRSPGLHLQAAGHGE